MTIRKNDIWAQRILGGIRRQASSKGIIVDEALTYIDLQDILEYQNYKCAITGLTLYTPDNELIGRQRLRPVYSQLSQEQVALLPILLAVLPEQPFAVGNIFFAANLIHMAYEHLGITRLVQLKVQAPKVMQPKETK